MSPSATKVEPSYGHIKIVASDLDGTLTVHGING